MSSRCSTAAVVYGLFSSLGHHGRTWLCCLVPNVQGACRVSANTATQLMLMETIYPLQQPAVFSLMNRPFSLVGLLVGLTYSLKVFFLHWLLAIDLISVISVGSQMFLDKHHRMRDAPCVTDAMLGAMESLT